MFKATLSTEELNTFETRFAEGYVGTGEQDATERLWRSYSALRRCVYTDRPGASTNASLNYLNINGAVTVNEPNTTLDRNVTATTSVPSSSLYSNDTAALNEVVTDSSLQYNRSFSDTSK